MTKIRKIMLAPMETMKQKRSKDRLKLDAGTVHEIVRKNPGIGGKKAIAVATGLTPQRVAEVIKRINAGETGHTPLQFGECEVRMPNGQKVVKRGWFGMNVRKHHHVGAQVSEHKTRVILGVRRSQLYALEAFEGMRGAEAAAVVASMEEDLGEMVEALSETDFETFKAMVEEEIEKIENGV